MPDIDLIGAVDACLKTHPTGNCTCEFNSCGIYNGSISDWNTANVTNMSDLFQDHDKFIADISRWDTSGVTDMSNMFHACKLFNIDIGSWDVSNVLNMRGMFSGARAFNADISLWNTAAVTSMSEMFSGATGFNVDITRWPEPSESSSMFSTAVGWRNKYKRCVGRAENDDGPPSAWAPSQICCENEYVRANTCVSCPINTTNFPGDDSTGSDTTCTSEAMSGMFPDSASTASLGTQSRLSPFLTFLAVFGCVFGFVQLLAIALHVRSKCRQST